MELSDIMQSVNPLCIDETVKSAMAKMMELEVNFLPVVDAEEVFCGVIKLNQLINAMNQRIDFITEFIDADILTYSPNINISKLSDQLDSLVVVDSQRKVLGIVTVLNLTLSRFKHRNHELTAILNSSYDGIFITDHEGRVLNLNKAYERITGICAGNVVGKTMRELVDQGVYDQSVTLLVMDSLKSATLSQQIKVTDKQVLVTGNPIFNHGKLTRVVTNVRDITELTKLEREIQETKAQKLKYEAELSLLRSRVMDNSEIVYSSKSMGQIVDLATRVAHVNSNVLITGESGTGKELIARLIHKVGKGAKSPFIKINCGAIPEQLLESELFGYDGGAFTGAKKEGKPGMFELAHMGTLFLDEVGELPLMLQVKLLRAIQEKEILRVGGAKPIKVDVRIVTATHRNLLEMVKNGKFREDLYYRLMVVPIQLPPLRDRREDIPYLVATFLDRFNAKFGYSKTITHEVLNKFLEYPWPGNIRELQNVIERMMVVSQTDELAIELLPDTIHQKSVYIPKKSQKLKAALAETEGHILKEAYGRLGCWQKVADELGIDRTTVFRKIAKYKLTSIE